MRYGLLVVMVAAIVAAGAPVAQAQVKIGVVGPLTGPVAPTGHTVRNGVQLAADEINRAGGIPGVGRIEVIAEDSKCRPDDAVNATQKVVNRDRVHAVIGDVCSSATLAMQRATRAGETPQLTAVSSANSITKQGNPFMFQVQANDTIAAAVMAEFAVRKLGLKKFAILHDQQDYGKDGADTIEATLKKHNINVLTRESFRFRDTDFSGQLLKIKGTNPEGVFLWGIYGEISLAMKQAKQLGMTFTPLASDAQAYPDYPRLAGEAANGTYTEAVFAVTDPNPRVQEFVRKYRAAFNADPDPGAAMAYDTMYIVAKAAEAAKSSDGKKLRDAIAKIRYEGVTGILEFDDHGAVKRPSFILQVRDGKHYRVE